MRGALKAACVVLLATLTAAGALIGGVASANSGSASRITQTLSWGCPTDTTYVDISGSYFAFVPATVDVAPGTTVCWMNQDGWTHTVTSDTGAFDSDVLLPAWAYTFTFNTPGSYAYHDALYPSRTGTVNVDTQPPPPPPRPGCPTGVIFVDISGNFGFDPATLNVPSGTTVCWTNQDGLTHTVTSDTGAFDSGDLLPGWTSSFTFNRYGSYEYHDALNPSMTGTVNVPPPLPPPPPPPPPPFTSCPTGATLVDIRTFGFVPATVDVARGTTVCWMNDDGWTHTVTSDTGAFDSGVIGLTGTFPFTFDTTGSYAYHDALYPCLTGTVNVDTDPPPLAPPPPCPPRNPTGCPTGTTYVEILHGFNPVTVKVAPGTTVCWWNRDGWGHTVTSDTGAFDSGVIGTGSYYSFTFNTTGSYAYHDALYPERTGTVNVSTAPLPPSGSFIVPRVIGLKVAIARSRIRRSHGSVGRVRRVRSRRVGRVIVQRPAPGKRLAMGARVSLVVGRR